MIEFKKFILPNGLRLLVHQDNSTPLAVVNLLYNVGARNESENKTGFAHLFEHLMFGGSVNIPSFDSELQKAGGENNAFTSNDITNYYITLPSQNLETALWLESDRMKSLAFSPQSLEVQRKVVSEEFKEHYINQPYGDAWHKLRALAYTTHSYKWPTIGKDLSHIENATLEDVKDFFFKHYRPDNAILVVAGNVNATDVLPLVEKYFGDIVSQKNNGTVIPAEPKQTEERKLTVEADVPLNIIYKAYHMCGRMEKDFYATDLLSDLFSGGKSGRLYQALVKEKKLFSELDAYITSSIDPGMFVIEGKLLPEIGMGLAEESILEEIEKMKSTIIADDELQKVKNRTESQMIFAEVEPLHKAMNLAYSELLGDANFINADKQKYQEVTAEQIKNVANKMLVTENCSTLYYLKKK